MNNKIQLLLQLIKENPDLTIIPMVYYEVVDGDYNRWMGSIGDCYVGEYAILNERYYEDRDEFEEDYYDYNMEEINEQFGYDPCICKTHIDTGLITKEQYEFAQNRIEELLPLVSDEMSANHPLAVELALMSDVVISYEKEHFPI